MKKNFAVDLIIFISGIICIVTGIILDFHFVKHGTEIRHIVRNFHTYSGYIMTVGLIFHIFWHMNWIKNSAKNIFK